MEPQNGTEKMAQGERGANATSIKCEGETRRNLGSIIATVTTIT